MLVHDGEEGLARLPALSPEWGRRWIQGMKIIGGHTLSFSWKDSRVTDVLIKVRHHLCRSFKSKGKIGILEASDCGILNITAEKLSKMKYCKQI